MEARRFDSEKDSFDELMTLFKTGLGDTDRAFWEWKYLQPNGFDKQVMYVIEDNSELVAMMGFIPLEYIDTKNNIHKLVQMCDLVVRPDHRGQGLFYKIYDYAEKDLTAADYEAFVSFPNHNSLHGFEKMNYRIEHMKHYPIGVDYLKLIEHRLGLGNRYSNKSGYEIYITDSNLSKEICTFNKENSLSRGSISINIDPAYISWRCESYNADKYKAIIVKDAGQVIAYFIVLVTKGRRATAGKIVNFDIDTRYVKELNVIAVDVKSAIYSFTDMIDFYGIWSTDIEATIIEAFGINRSNIRCGAEFIIKMLEDIDIIEDDLFINHIDTDL